VDITMAMIGTLDGRWFVLDGAGYGFGGAGVVDTLVAGVCMADSCILELTAILYLYIYSRIFTRIIMCLLSRTFQLFALSYHLQDVFPVRPSNQVGLSRRQKQPVDHDLPPHIAQTIISNFDLELP
jgi:hypothetical protein